MLKNAVQKSLFLIIIKSVITSPQFQRSMISAHRTKRFEKWFLAPLDFSEMKEGRKCFI